MTASFVGKVFNNRYRITERIGIGGMAEVYRAQDNVLGRTVAVKVMLPQYAADETFTHRFRQEAAAAANLQSPYIVNVYDWGQDDGTYYIVMEYIRGTDLKTAIKERGRINQRKVAEIGSQVCAALSVAHGLDIVHRDVKPQNIMIQPDGNVKVMDFGIARAKNSTMSKTSSVLGTAHYVSPEQAQGKELTAASDIYSLGIVLYEAATGQLPFDGPDAVSVAMKQVNEYPVPPRQINPEIDQPLEAIIMKALEKDPRRRFLTAGSMKQALNDYLAGRAVSVGPAAAAAAGFTGAQTQKMNSAYTRPSVPDNTSVMQPIEGGSTPRHGNATNYNTNNTKKKKMSGGKKAAIIIFIIAIIAGCGIGAWALTNTDTGVAVPDVTGKTVTEATTTLTQAGFTVGSTSQVYSETVDSGKVTGTDPQAGSKAEKGSKVNISVSRGTEQVEVPDLAGKNAEQAQAALTQAGLTSATGTPQYSSTVPKDIVLSQDQTPGSRIDKGSTVTFVISMGVENIDVPNVLNASEDVATTTLQNAGFVVNSTYDFSSITPEGAVMSQSPTASSKAPKGSTVTITVSKGEEKIDVNSIIGTEEVVRDAKNALESEGLKVSVTGYTSSDAVVDSWTPATAKKGDTITITGKKPVAEKSSSDTGTTKKDTSSTTTDDE